MIVVGVLLVTIRMEGNSSLKEKRRVVKSLLGRVKARFNASASEVDGQDRYELAVVGFSVMGSDARVLNRVLDHILNFVDDNVDAEVIDSEIICPLYADENDNLDHNLNQALDYSEEYDFGPENLNDPGNDNDR
ncbi:MAG: DUF503 domain-containing protein [Deltaproteobacteria bacterium]|jgi:uncharacterized protein YlxP (DUF503 family)|nr:DUF503 domain-containing protein [Deltaproteobacteria bacterium]